MNVVGMLVKARVLSTLPWMFELHGRSGHGTGRAGSVSSRTLLTCPRASVNFHS